MQEPIFNSFYKIKDIFQIEQRTVSLTNASYVSHNSGYTVYVMIDNLLAYADWVRSMEMIYYGKLTGQRMRNMGIVCVEVFR